MTLSTLDQRFLDMMDRIEQTQNDTMAEIIRRLAAVEKQNIELGKRLESLEILIERRDTALSSLNSSLARFLDPSASSPPSGTSPDASGT